MFPIMRRHYAKSFKKPENQTVNEHINDTGPQRSEKKDGLYFGKGKASFSGVIAPVP
jgi:hypothetical protein